MRKVKKPEDLSIEELRQLLVEKRRKIRMEHLERFRNTGRALTLTPDLESTSDENFPAESIVDQEVYEPSHSRHQRSKRILDRFLLFIEILAVVGLFFVIYSGIQILRDLNSQFAQSLTPATLTPTPLIMPVILPSGHTPPNSPGGAQLNEAEIPSHTRRFLPFQTIFASSR